MIGKGVKNYVMIRTAVFGLRLIAPASLGYLAVSLFRKEFLLSAWLGLYACTEASFYLFVYLPRHHIMQTPAIHPPSLTYEERQALFRKCRSYPHGDDFPTGWFQSPDIRREDVVLWILWALFSTETHRPEWEEEINEYVSDIENLLGRTFEPGYNDKAKSMRLTFDPVVAAHRPLVWYIIVGGVDFYSSFSIRTHGFTHYATPGWFRCFPPRPQTILSNRSVDPGLSYWYRPHRSTTKLPILFLHGIGIGLWPYIPFFSDLVNQDPDVGIIIIELLHISMHMTSPPLSRDANCRAISRILASLQIPRVTLVSHSYGTVLTTHILHDSELSPMISSTLLIDPIPFLLHLPNVAFNFVYRKPRSANEWQLWYFASRDIDVSRTLSRHFFWAENILWKEELEGPRVGVVLSGADQIVDAEGVRMYLTGEERITGTDMTRQWKDGLELLFYPDLDHAMVFDTKDRRKSVLDIVHRFVQLQ